jgi:hypothetical protein
VALKPCVVIDVVLRQCGISTLTRFRHSWGRVESVHTMANASLPRLVASRDLLVASMKLSDG